MPQNAAPSDNENALFHDIISIAAGEGRSLLPWCLEPDKQTDHNDQVHHRLLLPFREARRIE